MPTVTANGIEIYYESHGDGQPLVLISGIGYTNWEWQRMVPYLADRFRVISFDNRGVGQTDKPAGPYTAHMLAADTVGLLDALGIEKAVIMGHSMGGFIAQALAIEFPHKVGRLILCSTSFGGPRQIPVAAEAMKVLTDVSGDPLARFRNGLFISTAPGWAEKNPDIIQEWIEWRAANPIEPAPYQAQLAIGLGLLKEEAAFETQLHRIHAPTLILFGQYDMVVPPGNASLLAEKIVDSRVVILPNAGHFFPIEVPGAASQAVIDFAG
jgi:3-oxoadipate enol-lactonase